MKVLLYLLLLKTFLYATHFRGGYISWQPISPTRTNVTSMNITIQQIYSWASLTAPCVQLTGSMDNLLCISSNCTIYKNKTTVRGPCVNYDYVLNVTTTQNTQNILLRLNDQLVLAYQSNQWIPVISSAIRWSLTTYINLVVRTDNGRINSSPTSIFPSTVTVPLGIQQKIRISMADIDHDIVKCRWAINASLVASTIIDECGDGCEDMPGAQIYSSSNTDNNCTLIFNASTIGYYIIAIQIEDFPPSSPNSTALSSIPLQFLVRSVKISCDLPTIIGELHNEATIEIQVNILFSISIIAQVGCNNSVITRFSTITLPSSLAATSTIIMLNTTHYSTIFMWTPTFDQIGTKELYCTTAIDSNNLQSEPYCLNLIVILPTTTTVTTIISELKSDGKSSINWALILGISLPLLFLLTLLSCLCMKYKCWKNRPVFPARQSRYSNHIKKSDPDDIQLYRQQYVNNNSDRRNSLNSSSMTATFPPEFNNNINDISFKTDSILIQAYTEQKTIKKNF